MTEDVFHGLGVLIELNEAEDFLKVKETLTRIGIENRRTRHLYQSCHILHKRGKYAILHFKELFILDGKPSDIDEDDIKRRNTIAKLLGEWGLVKIVEPDFDNYEFMDVKQLKILPYSQKSEWTLESKYTIGKK